MRSEVYTLDYGQTHREKMRVLAMTNGKWTKEVFLQTFSNPMDGTIKSIWVVDGFYNKKEYKTYQSAERAYFQAIGKLVDQGYFPSHTSETFRARFK